ncbi:50S ribosomal protein L6 [Bacteroidota bacterium]
MSRIGILPIDLPSGVTVTISETNEVMVKGPKGEISQQVNPEIKVEIKENQVLIERPSDEKRHKSLHGLYRSLINNMVVGVSEGFTIKQELVGVGYRAEAKGQILELSLGFSHDVHFQIPNEVKVEAVQERRQNPIITLTSVNKQLIGEVAAKIRSLRPPEPYKGKGIKFVGEQLRRKAGKSASV